MLAHRAASLHQIANALLTWPTSEDPAPDTVLVFNHDDSPHPSTLSYCRPASRGGENGGGGRGIDDSRRIFPVPHFGFYAWPISTIGSFGRAAAAISELEDGLVDYPGGSVDGRWWWDRKIPQAVWRGTPWFNSPTSGSGRMRQDLLTATRNKTWADVEATTGGNALPIEDFCRYRYVVYTEGVTYSGRLQYHQLCASVVLSPPIAWMQHTSHLIRPLFSSSLPGVRREPISSSSAKLAPYPAPSISAAWPRSYPPAKANMIFVAPDWSDLESTVEWLEAHPQVAAGIAERQRNLFAGGGYFSPAAEMCYWRALIRGWAQVARPEGQGWDGLEGVSWEEFSLTEVHK
jgi:hypothetical protein